MRRDDSGLGNCQGRRSIAVAAARRCPLSEGTEKRRGYAPKSDENYNQMYWLCYLVEKLAARIASQGMGRQATYIAFLKK